MLIEITSPVFKEKGKERPPIRFKEGLNVVLGKEDGENSIGKSSAMLAIDFAFDGNSFCIYRGGNFDFDWSLVCRRYLGSSTAENSFKLIS